MISDEASRIRIEEVAPSSREAVWCLAQYYAELRSLFPEGFDAAKSLASDPEDFQRPSGLFLVAFLDDRPIGCGGVKLTSLEAGYIKRMWIDSSRRGLGLGRTLLAALEHGARDLGCAIVQLETNRVLSRAIHLYRTSGYREVEAFNDEYYAHHWFEKELAGEHPADSALIRPTFRDDGRSPTPRSSTKTPGRR